MDHVTCFHQSERFEESADSIRGLRIIQVYIPHVKYVTHV